jgi:cytochrome c biogenesis protein CcmG/thiol:disulfide interchange protein DsbE
MKRTFCVIWLVALTVSGLMGAEAEREWMTDEETGQRIFAREVILSSEQIREMINALDQFAPINRDSFSELKKKVQDPSAKLTIIDVAGVASLEKKEMAWFYELLATNKDPVVRFFGLIPKVMVLKDRAAATNLYQLPRSGLPPSKQWLVENCLHAIGIDPYGDSPAEIFEFLSTTRDEVHPPVGSVAKEFHTKTLDGRNVRLSSFAGKPVLLHFWSTTCGPCIAELPELEKQLKRFKTVHPELVVLGVSLDDNLKQVNTFLQKYDLPWTVVSDKRGWGGEAAKAFHITSIPSDVVIDNEGRVRGYSRTVLSELLKQSPN